jgi:hypothetical protein
MIGMVEEVGRDTGFVDLYCLVMLKIGNRAEVFYKSRVYGQPCFIHILRTSNIFTYLIVILLFVRTLSYVGIVSGSELITNKAFIRCISQ